MSILSSCLAVQAMWEPVADEELHAAFRAFASFGAGMNGTPKSATTPKALELDGARFAKLVRDSGLLDARLATTAVDLVFSKVKAKVCSPAGQLGISCQSEGSKGSLVYNLGLNPSY